MPSPWFDSLNFASVCLCGGGLLFALWLGTRDGSRYGRILHLLLTVLAAAAATFAIVAACAGQSLAIWGSATAVALLYLLVVVLPSPLVARCLTAAVQRSRVRHCRRLAMLGVPALCPFVALALVYAELPPPLEISEEQLAAGQLVVVEPTGEMDSPLTTDLGRSVRVLQTSGDTWQPTAARLASQDRMLSRWELHDQVIYVPLGWQNTNCHGFVFTAGRYWVGGAQVNAILEDNGYQPVAAPCADDIAVYRDVEGKVLHSAIVRGVAAGGMVLVESKWGQAGRFVHRHDRHPYPDTTCTFYRSLRQGHLLRGLGPGSSEPIAPRPPPRDTVVGL